MIRTSVPKTGVEEYDDFAFFDGDIRFSGKSGDVFPVSYSFAE